MYVALLNEKLSLIKINESTVFVYDSTLCHRCKKVNNYLMTAKVTTLEWPEHCPNLNRMYDLCGIMKRKVADKQPSSASVLVDTIRNIWV